MKPRTLKFHRTQFDLNKNGFTEIKHSMTVDADMYKDMVKKMARALGNCCYNYDNRLKPVSTLRYGGKWLIFALFDTKKDHHLLDIVCNSVREYNNENICLLFNAMIDIVGEWASPILLKNCFIDGNKITFSVPYWMCEELAESYNPNQDKS